MAARALFYNGYCGNVEFPLSNYPDSMPVYKALVENGTVASLISTGAIFREAFCGPCFGAGDTPANNELSIRHTTRNFPNREGSKPNEGQIASVCLMDARSIAATSRNQGVLTAASDICHEDEKDYMCPFDASLYEKRVFNGYGKEDPDYPIHFGPKFKNWTAQPSLRSQITLSRRDPDYVNEAKKVKEMDWENEEVKYVYALLENSGITVDPDTNIASSIYAYKPGDGSAREQAASCQRVLGAGANFAHEYATKRYRSNCINWGMLPFLTTDDALLEKGSWVLVKNVKEGLESNTPMKAYVVLKDAVTMIEVSCGALTRDEIEILEDGCLINYYKHD